MVAQKDFSLTVHNMPEYQSFQRLVLLCAAEKIEWETPHGHATAVFSHDPVQGFVYKAASFTIPAEKFMQQMIEAGIVMTKTNQFAPGHCVYV